MKRWINYFFFLLVLILLIGLASEIQSDPGVIFIRYQNIRIQTTLWFGILALLVFLGFLHVIIAFFRFLINLPKNLSHYVERRSASCSQENMLKGFSCLIAEENLLAEKYFVKATKEKNLSFINYLLAAQAAEAEKNTAHRERYLQHAASYADRPELKEALELLYIKQVMAEGRDEMALFHLLALYQKKSGHPVVLKWLKRLYLKMNDWVALYSLFPKLKKVLSSEEWSVLQSQVYEGLLKQYAINGKILNDYLSFWSKVPKSFRRQTQILIAYVEGLNHYGAQKEAEVLLVKALKKHPDKPLILYYLSFPSFQQEKQITLLETIILKQPPDSQLLLSLGQWCVKNRLWGKAEKYLQQSFEMNPQQEKACLELGHLYLQLGSEKKAMEAYSCYQKMLDF